MEFELKLRIFIFEYLFTEKCMTNVLWPATKQLGSKKGNYHEINFFLSLQLKLA